MTDELFFNKLVTKAMEAVHGDERFFEGYLTVQIKDKQGEITVVDELYKVLPIWMDRGAPISDTHSNRIIGKGINYSKEDYKDKDGEVYPAIKITGKIHKDYELDNEIWKKIKSGEYKGLSFGGATKSDRDPVRMKDGSIAYSLKDLEHYEVAVCADPAVPLALITDYNPVAKSATNAEVREDGKMIIKCDKFGCYISKPIPDGKGGKGDFDHCEEKNQDKNNPAAFCGAIQHKLEKAIEAGMLQQVVKNGLEIFLTKEELNKVCSACGKTLEEHGIIKYDHSNSMGDQHSMYNQNSGSETWIGQGLPQPTVEGKDDNPAEQGLTVNADAMQNSKKKDGSKKCPMCEKELKLVHGRDDAYECTSPDCPSNRMGEALFSGSKKKGRTARNRKRRQAKQIKEGMSMFDTPNEVDNILSEAQAEVDAQAEDTKRYNTGNPKAADMYKSLESMFKTDQADKETEESLIETIAEDKKLREDDETSRKEKEEFDVPLPRVTKEPQPCKDCGGEHDDISLLTEDIAQQRAIGNKEHSYDLVSPREHILPNLSEAVVNDKSDELTNKSFVSIFKKKDPVEEKQIQEGIEGLEGGSSGGGSNWAGVSFTPTEGDDCPMCKKDPEGSGKPAWWRDRANNWQKFMGGDKKMGEWWSDHISDHNDTAQREHDSDASMYHTQAKELPKSKKRQESGLNTAGQSASNALHRGGFPPSKEESENHKKRREAFSKLHGARRKKSLESIVSKVTEGQFGAGQRGLGYGNEGYTNVQGSGQNHTISEIPPEMEVIVHDIDEIKEVKRAGYTTEAGNSKRGDPSRATDDDDSLLSPKYI